MTTISALPNYKTWFTGSVTLMLEAVPAPLTQRQHTMRIASVTVSEITFRVGCPTLDTTPQPVSLVFP